MIIENWKVEEEIVVKPTKTVAGISKCPYPSCPTNRRPRPRGSEFKVINMLEDGEPKFRCVYCGALLRSEVLKDFLGGEADYRALDSREKIRETLLSLLLKKGGIKVARSSSELFTLKCGRASAYFVNIGLLTDGESLVEMKRLLAGYIVLLLKEGELEDFDFVFGPAYKGINLATLACEGLRELYGLNKRILYDRKEEKTYGDVSAERIIVGAAHFKEGQRILLIDDVATTGGTKVESLKKLELLGPHRVVGMVLVVDREEKMGDAVEVGEMSAVQFIRERLKVKVFPILDVRTIFKLVKDCLPSEVRRCWVEYYEKYGAVRLSHSPN